MLGKNVIIPKAVYSPTVQVDLIDRANTSVIGSFVLMDSAGGITTYTTETNGSKVITGLVQNGNYQINTNIAGYYASTNNVSGSNRYNVIKIQLQERLEEVSLTFKVVKPPPSTTCEN
jgi:hypothetical protein